MNQLFVQYMVHDTPSPPTRCGDVDKMRRIATECDEIAKVSAENSIQLVSTNRLMTYQQSGAYADCSPVQNADFRETGAMLQKNYPSICKKSKDLYVMIPEKKSCRNWRTK